MPASFPAAQFRPAELPASLAYLDNNVYSLADRDAARVARSLPGGQVPRPGQEVLVEFAGLRWFLSRGAHRGRPVWQVTLTDWRCIDRRLVLSSPFDCFERFAPQVFAWVARRAASQEALCQ